MAEVRVRFFATFREISRINEGSENAADLSGLLEVLIARYGESFARLVRDRSGDSFVILVNGRNSGQLDGMATRLSDGDEVSLFPPLSGG